MVSIIEQEICIQSTMFVGSAISTWSLVVQRKRLTEQMFAKLSQKVPATENVREMVIGGLMQDNYNAGVLCEVDKSASSWHEMEANTSFAEVVGSTKWLDTIACEEELKRGGQCSVAVCL